MNTRTCPVCGDPVPLSDSPGRPPRFCSPYCQRKAAKARELVRSNAARVAANDELVRNWLGDCGIIIPD